VWHLKFFAFFIVPHYLNRSCQDPLFVYVLFTNLRKMLRLAGNVTLIVNWSESKWKWDWEAYFAEDPTKCNFCCGLPQGGGALHLVRSFVWWWRCTLDNNLRLRHMHATELSSKVRFIRRVVVRPAVNQWLKNQEVCMGYSWLCLIIPKLGALCH